MHKLILRRSVILFMCFILLSGISIIFISGNVPFTVCGPGFGPWHYNSRIEAIQKEFNGEIPNDIDIVSFRCMSWQDSFFQTEFLMSEKSAKTLIQTMEHSYLNTSPRDNEYPFNTSMASKSKKEWVDGSYKHTEYYLPSYGGYYVKEVKVSTRIDGKDMPRIYLTAYTW